MKAHRIIRIVLLLAICSTQTALAQDKQNMFNPIHTAVTSLNIAPDARAGAMGDMGAATEADIYSQYWNPAKYPFNVARAGVGVSYTPWLRKLVNDINLANLTGFYRIGNYSAVHASLRYFSLGEATSSSRVEKTSGGTTTSTYYKNKVKLIITEAGAQEAALTSEELAAREALANNKAKEKEEGKTGTNTDKNNTNNNNNNNQTSQSSSSGEPDLNKKTEIPSDAKIDDALVGNWKYEESGLTMTYEFKSDGTGVAGIMGSSMNFKYGTKDGKIYANSDVVETSTSAGTAKQRIDGIMDYTVSGDTLKLTSNGQVIDFKKQ